MVAAAENMDARNGVRCVRIQTIENEDDEESPLRKQSR